MSEKKYDLVVIGAGPGGYVASIVAAQKGMKVANIEKRETLGGTCLNVGCIPSKALLHASEQYENNVKNNANLSWGIKTSDVSIDVQQLMKKKSTIVDELTKGINFLFSKNRLNVAITRAKCLAVVVFNERLLTFPCRTPEQINLLNTFCWLYRRYAS